jgi:WS/DGAT/MGAT family acyltransferase
MQRTHYERLSAQDASFLGIEEANARWHEGAVMVFDPGPLAAPEGGVDAARITAAYAAALDRVERYRQRLAYIPFFEHPVWVDDPTFNIRYHIRHISLPRPGDERILKRVCGYLLSQPLDLNKPLWEVWIVDGLDDGRFALVTKTHHCMVDGASGMSILGGLLSTEPETPISEPKRWKARPAPAGAELVRDEVTRRLRAPLELLRPLQNPREALQSAWEVTAGLVEASRLGWKGASETPFNPEKIGPHRRFDWVSMELSDIKDVKNRLGGTVNDVVLTAAAGAVGSFLRRRQERPGDLDFRVLIPVNIRSEAETGRMGNRVAMMMAELPIGEKDPRKRLKQVIASTQQLKRSRQARGVEGLQDLADRLGGRFFQEIIRTATRARPFNLSVTNVPGPQFPLFLAGAQLRGIYPMIPLFSNQALGIAVMSYDGEVFWGFNSDWDSLPDVHDLVDDLGVEFEKLRKRAAIEITSKSGTSDAESA